MNPWKLLNGRKTIIGSVLLITSAFSDQVLMGIWDVAWSALPQISSTCDWFGMALGGVGLAHKWQKRKPTQ